MIGLVERYDRRLHGHTESTSQDIDGRSLVLETYDPAEFAEDPTLARAHLASLRQARKDLSTSSPSPSLELVTVIRLDGGEDVAEFRTHGITLFQRIWRRSIQIPL